jgi:tRNA (cmo5U34)-methyltransferase
MQVPLAAQATAAYARTMKEPTAPILFDKEQAASYDKQFAKLAPMRDGLHLAMHISFMDLPPDAKILCVGAGTGAELLYLANAFPGWRFTLVDPAAAMLDVCRERAAQSGLIDRCTFHEGYVDSLPVDAIYDAATSLLVSHFILDRDSRVTFFREIAKRVAPGGLLVSADIASPEPIDGPESLLDLWIRALQFSGMTEEMTVGYRKKLAVGVSILPPTEIAVLHREAGFEDSRLISHNLLMHGWLAQLPR